MHVVSFQIASVDVDLLPENRTKEGQALIEAITEEDREKEEFRRRKTEVLEKIRLQEDEFREMQDMVSSLEAKVYSYRFFLITIDSDSCFFPEQSLYIRTVDKQPHACAPYSEIPLTVIMICFMLKSHDVIMYPLAFKNSIISN